MSQEPEDVKPKLNLNITYEGNQITVKVKANTKFAKIFTAAEQRFGKDAGKNLQIRV
ncbi:Ubiquitin-like protein SMT3 [Mycena venus]|uniref:Ubiquitin-like protein SMT3 n=1 Tax=Mycena venus TaxID=2733690 RepID=A0A8H7C9F1_9AGAR|nr:Ubiquitin-like protein SMT3 [Mycena venus]